MSSEIAIQIEGLSKTYRLYDRPGDRLMQAIFPGKQRFTERHALQPLSLSVYKGETVGIVGCNGSGKSTLLQLICNTLTPTTGNCKVHGKVAALLELGSGFNPEFTGRENIYLNATLLGLSREEIDARYEGIVAFSGLGDAVMQPVKTYSSGMYVRLAFAVASAVEPDIFIIDEALAVGDERFQRKCYSRIKEMKAKGTTILFVSHAANSIIDICDRAVLLDQGDLLLVGHPKYVISQYHHLIYAPDHKREQIKQEIKHLGNDEMQEERLEDVFPTHMFIPDMQPETTLSHDSKGAVIENWAITTPEGEQVNLLLQRGHYCLEYTVKFTENCLGVRFNYFIQTPAGVMVNGSNTHKFDASLAIVPHGSTYRACFHFQCLLLPGYYYVTLGCGGLIKGEHTPLHRVADAMMFRVLPDPAIQAGGIADILTEAAIEVLPVETKKEVEIC